VIETGLQRRGDQDRAAGPPGSPEASGPSEHEPVTPAVPNTLLGRAADEPPADDLLWEWSRWAPLAAPMSVPNVPTRNPRKTNAAAETIVNSGSTVRG